MVIICAIMAFAAVGLLGFALYMGMFSSMKIKVKRLDGMRIMYYDYQGEISNIGKEFTALSKMVQESGVPHEACCGIYYDSPYILVDKNKMRASIGFILDQELSDKQKTSLLQKRAFKSAVFSPADFVYGEWPYKNTLSLMLGPLKFYPRLDAFLVDNGLSSKQPVKDCGIMEHYDFNNGCIRFYAPTTTASEFCLSGLPKPRYRTDQY